MELDKIMSAKPINTKTSYGMKPENADANINLEKSTGIIIDGRSVDKSNQNYDKSVEKTSYRVKKTHLFELLQRDLSKEAISNHDSDNLVFDFSGFDSSYKHGQKKKQYTERKNKTDRVEVDLLGESSKQNESLSYSAIVNHKHDNKTTNLFMSSETMCKRLKEIMFYREYNDPVSLLNRLNFTQNDNFIVISTNEINESLRHTDLQFDRVLHQTKLAIFEKSTFLPLFYLEKSIKDSESFYTQNENSYLKHHVYDVIDKFREKEFDKLSVSIHKNHIGSYIVLFYHKNKWYFMFSGNVYEFNQETHSILYEHIGSHLPKFDKTLCYHMILVDTRLQKLITPICDANHVVLVKTTEKYTLIERSNVVDKTEKRYGVFLQDTRIYISCMDELNVRLEELDIKNTRAKKLLNRGFLMKIKIDAYDEINISYDTCTYKRLMAMIPGGLGLHGVHLKLYQIDKLNYFLQYINDSYNDIVKRINMSLSTMSREILDIYHMTRKKKNSELYTLLPQSYRQILYQLHSDYIEQKNNTTSVTGTDETSDNENCQPKEAETDSSDDSENKVSISVDNVYTKLKELDTSLLIDLYKDREELLKNIENVSDDDEIKNPIKDCINTRLQTTFLRSNRPV